MKIKLNKCEGMEDWYTIIRAEHDGTDWAVQTRPNCFQHMTSARLVPNACIEGTSSEMLELARAIVKGKTAEFKRCAVYFDTDGVHFYSPKNSTEDGVVTEEEAYDFASQVFEEIYSQV